MNKEEIKEAYWQIVFEAMTRMTGLDPGQPSDLEELKKRVEDLDRKVSELEMNIYI